VTSFIVHQIHYDSAIVCGMCGSVGGTGDFEGREKSGVDVEKTTSIDFVGSVTFAGKMFQDRNGMCHDKSFGDASGQQAI
jgi:hypothetical protein